MSINIQEYYKTDNSQCNNIVISMIVPVLLENPCNKSDNKRLSLAVNNLFIAYWQLVTCSGNITCSGLVDSLATCCEIFTCIGMDVVCMQELSGALGDIILCKVVKTWTLKCVLFGMIDLTN